MGFTLGFDVAFARDVVELCPKHRHLLLLGTALGSTLIAFSASPSFAANCTQPASPSPITVNGAATPISCANTVARTATVAGDNAIDIVTTGNGNTVDITNSGPLTTTSTSLVPQPPNTDYSQSTGARGIYAGTNGIGADITINNSGTINSYSDSIEATDGATSGTVLSGDTHITITNSGNLTAGPNAEGIYANASYGSNNLVTIDNSGAIQTGASASPSGTSSGIFVAVDGDNSQINVTNSGAISTIGDTASGISAIANYYNGDNGSIVIDNKAAITTTGAGAYGILAQAGGIAPNDGGTVTITNTATVSAGYMGIAGFTYGSGGDITIDNKGNITAGTGGYDGSDGIKAVANGGDATISITNSGVIDTTAGGAYSIGIEAINTPCLCAGSNTNIFVTNTAAITTGADSAGILARSIGDGAVVTIDNSGNIQTGPSTSGSGNSFGIFATVAGEEGQINVNNNGSISTVGDDAIGIGAANYYAGSDSSIVIDNKSGGTITTTGSHAAGIFAASIGPYGAGTIEITNAATINSGYIGIGAVNYGSGGDITITNKAAITTGTGGHGSTGIRALAYGGDSTIVITNSGAIDTTAGGAYSNGIEAVNGSPVAGSSADISITNTAAITTGVDSVGISAYSVGSGSTVMIDNSGAIQTGASSGSTFGYSSGIFAIAEGDGSQISITNDGTITTVGTNAAGIWANANAYDGANGSIVIDNKAGGSIVTTKGAYGIFAMAGNDSSPDNGGTIQITNAATISSGYVGIGSFAYGGGSGITITNKAAITSGNGGYDGSSGILAVADGSDSTISITNSGAIDTTAGGANSSGIEADNGTCLCAASPNPQVSVTNTAAITTGADSVGIFARSTGAGGMVSVDNSGAIETGASTSSFGGSSGIFADVDGDNSQLNVTNNGAIHTVGANAAGIWAMANYYSGSNGNVVVNNKAGGTITTTVSDAFGIFAQAGSLDGAPPNANDGGTVEVTNAAAINAGAKGIGAYTYGSHGTVTVTNSGAIVSTSAGVYAKSNGDDSNVIITNQASVSSLSGDAAISAFTAGANSSITITTSGNTTGVGGFGVIADANGASSTVVINGRSSIHGALGGIRSDSTAGSTINVDASGSLSAGNNLAIKSLAGTAAINNDGVILGRVELSDAGNVMNINGNGVFRAFTDSKFGAGNDTLNNDGTINASGSYFGSSPNTVGLLGLENFVNGSTGSGAGLTTMIDGVTGDKLTISGNFTGQGNSVLGVDVDFSSGTADTLTIGGNASGHTDLVVNATRAGAPAVFIPVVTVAGTTAEGDFDLATPIKAGFFTYGLFLQGNTHGLRSTGLSNAAFELPAGVTGAQDVWLGTTGFWQDRMADLRIEQSGVHNADMPEDKLAARMGGLWARASGDWSNRDSTINYTDPVSLLTGTLDLDRKQRTGAFLGGIDMGLEGVAGGDMLFGVMGGYVTSRLDFKATDDSWNYKGGTVGAYATFLNGGFYLDGLVKADFLDVDINDVGGKASTNATNIGMRLDTGYRVVMGWGFIEPQASLEWVHTNMATVSLFGGAIDFQNGSSGRAKIGVRIGTYMPVNGMTVSPDLTLSVWNHFGSDNAVDINFPGSAFSATDSAGNGTSGEVGVGVNVASASNWSGVVRGSVRFGDRYSAGSIGAALRYGW
ncbi:beta strand repeat-containing protein [Mesorhizobium calcicola]|uniref:Beta strand repeat-containing protein n=1 Tax=Mesorhizobium calcicola TaxID=1300310 RepID=A0ABW4WPS4_9HYPH